MTEERELDFDGKPYVVTTILGGWMPPGHLLKSGRGGGVGRHLKKVDF